METQTVLCCSRGLKEIHLLLLFTKFASQLLAELPKRYSLVRAEREGGGEEKVGCVGKREGAGKKWKSFPTFSDNHYL